MTEKSGTYHKIKAFKNTFQFFDYLQIFFPRYASSTKLCSVSLLFPFFMVETHLIQHKLHTIFKYLNILIMFLLTLKIQKKIKQKCL